MKKQTIVFSIINLLVIVAITNAQVVIPADKEQLLKGEVAGQTLIAENNGFLSPQKILALKEELGLTKTQIKKINEMLENSQVSSIVKGEEIVEAEEEFGKLFKSGTIDEKTMRAKLERIGKLRAELRFVHLQVHLKAKQILSVNQLERLKKLRANEIK